MKKKLLALGLSVLMTFTMMPSVFAAEPEENVETVEVSNTVTIVQIGNATYAVNGKYNSQQEAINAYQNSKVGRVDVTNKKVKMPENPGDVDYDVRMFSGTVAAISGSPAPANKQTAVELFGGTITGNVAAKAGPGVEGISINQKAVIGGDILNFEKIILTNRKLTAQIDAENLTTMQTAKDTTFTFLTDKTVTGVTNGISHNGNTVTVKSAGTITLDNSAQVKVTLTDNDGRLPGDPYPVPGGPGGNYPNYPYPGYPSYPTGPNYPTYPGSGIGWQYGAGGWWYCNADYTYPVNSWKQINGTWYYFNGNGYMVTGWQRVGGAWYYLSGTGAMVTGWQYIGGTWYYFNGNGVMMTGWVKLGNTWYYLSGSGAMLTGWHFINNNWYYLSGNGAMVTGWLYSNGQWYYMDANGAMTFGWQKVGNYWYYMDAHGVLQTNTVVPGGYRVNGNGAWIG